MERSHVHHLGGISGFASALAYYPKEKLTVVVLSNFETVTVRAIGEVLAMMMMLEYFLATQPDGGEDD